MKQFLLERSSLLLFAMVFVGFGVLSPKFLEADNLVNILIQSSSIAVTAIGMTFVLLTAGIDLSIGSIMFISAITAGKLALGGQPLALALGAAVVIGLVFGAANAVLVAYFKVPAFIATLGTLYLGRGLGLWLTETRAMNLPESILQIGSSRLGGAPIPILVFLCILVISHFVLARTPFGRRIYATGNNPEAAKKAGVDTKKILFLVYVVSGLCAAVGGLVSVAQLGAVSPSFGVQREFAATAAAVLGGTSLFGGKGKIWPGTVAGAVLIQTVENGLVIINADPYLYPLVMSAIIFLAVLIDSVRSGWFQKLQRRWAN
jgi:ribose transport system permease protein